MSYSVLVFDLEPIVNAIILMLGPVYSDFFHSLLSSILNLRSNLNNAANQPWGISTFKLNTMRLNLGQTRKAGILSRVIYLSIFCFMHNRLEAFSTPQSRR